MLEIWEDLVEMMHKSILVQGFITVVGFSVIAYKWATVQPVSDQETQVLWLILGFFFGAKSALASYSRKRERDKTND